MNFLLAVILAVCCAGTFAAFTMTEEQAKELQAKLDCINETGADIQTLLNIQHGIPTLYDDKTNCFAACMLEKFQIIKPDGSIDEEAARVRIEKSISKDKVETIVKICKPEVSKNKCLTGGRILECLIKNDAVPVLN